MDLQKIKDRLTQLQKTSNTSNSFWKPQPGKTQIRIVPYKFNKDNPFIELYFHYSMGNNKTYLSPVSFGPKKLPSSSTIKTLFTSKGNPILPGTQESDRG